MFSGSIERNIGLKWVKVSSRSFKFQVIKLKTFVILMWLIFSPFSAELKPAGLFIIQFQCKLGTQGLTLPS